MDVSENKISTRHYGFLIASLGGIFGGRVQQKSTINQKCICMEVDVTMYIEREEENRSSPLSSLVMPCHFSHQRKGKSACT